MKKILLFAFAIVLFSCKGGNSKQCKTGPFVIQGSVPSRQYEGETVYLVPAIGDNPSNVDSTKIINGKFTFKGDTERVCIVRLKPMLRLKLQDLLVVTEKGTTSVKLGLNSVGGGTRQNMMLQQWKDAIIKSGMDFARYEQVKDSGAREEKIHALLKQSDLSKKNADNLTLKIIRLDTTSTLSKFLTHLTGKR